MKRLPTRDMKVGVGVTLLGVLSIVWSLWFGGPENLAGGLGLIALGLLVLWPERDGSRRQQTPED